MEITEALRTFASTTPSIAGQLGGAGAFRWYPLTRPENVTYPCVTYQVISDPRSYTHEGDDRTRRTRLQATVWARTYGTLTTVAEALQLAVTGYAGFMGTVDVRGVFVDNAVDEFQPDTKIYNRNIDLILQHYEQ